jgi:hypothetical protein
MLSLALVALTVGAGLPPAQQSEPRLRPPAAVECPRDHLTSYVGVLQRYRREADRTELRIRTDWDTTEDVAIAHRGSDDPSRWFLMEGRPFQTADWARLEEGPRRLRAGMRAAAWVCDDGRNPIVDWNPPRER